MSDPGTTEATSRSLFGWRSPGRNIALIVVGTLVGGMFLAGWLSGALSFTST